MKRKKEKKRHKVRLLPCPSYDVRGIEEWLEEMAAQGWFLEKIYHWGSYILWVKFEQRPAKAARYRLQVINDFFAPYSGPTSDIKQAYEEFGWEYVGWIRDFYIYYTEDADAVELNTDERVQAITYERLRKHYTFLFKLNVITMLICFRSTIRFASDLILYFGLHMFVLDVFGEFLYVILTVRSFLYYRRALAELSAGNPLPRTGRRRTKIDLDVVHNIYTFVFLALLLVQYICYIIPFL